MKKLIYLFVAVVLFVGCKKEDNFEEITIQISGYLLPEKEVDLPITSNNLPFDIEDMTFQYINPLGDTITVNCHNNETIKIQKGTEKIKIKIKILTETDLNFVVYIRGCVEKMNDIDVKNYSGISVGIAEINADGTINKTIDVLGRHTKYISNNYNTDIVEDGIFEKYETEIPVKYLRYSIN